MGEAAIIKCRVQANPVAEISWFKGPDKTRIGLLFQFFAFFFDSFFFIFPENPNYEVVHDGLRINQVSMSDNDTFSCRADVLETGESRDFVITVIVSSMFKMYYTSCFFYYLIRTNQSSTYHLY